MEVQEKENIEEIEIAEENKIENAQEKVNDEVVETHEEENTENDIKEENAVTDNNQKTEESIKSNKKIPVVLFWVTITVIIACLCFISYRLYCYYNPKEPEAVAITSIEISIPELEIETNIPVEISTIIEPSNYNTSNLQWISSNPEIISVENLKEYDFGIFEGKTAEELESNPHFLPWASGKLSAPPEGENNSDFIKRLCIGLNQVVLDMLDKNVTKAAVIMHGGAIMMLLGATAVPRHKPVEWTADAGRGYSLLITPSLYHKSGIVEVYDIV